MTKETEETGTAKNQVPAKDGNATDKDGNATERVPIRKRRAESATRSRIGCAKQNQLCGAEPAMPTQLFGRKVHTMLISPVTAPSSRDMTTLTGNSGRPPASSSAITSATGRPSSAVAVTGPMASFL